MVETFVEWGEAARLRTAELDVSVNNPDAERLYRRLGFRVTEERASSLQNAHGSVANHLRMVRDLQPV
jgi:ribosomal protein S18 acetylase RimI-like enzyme